MTAEPITPNQDAPTCCEHGRQLDHLDEMLHSIVATLGKLEPLLPLIPRALAILDPGAAARRFIMPGRKGARADVS